MGQLILAFGLVAVISYLLGSLSFAVIISKFFKHDDVRQYGSGNAGMTNVLRTYGKLPALLTTLGDFSKGLASVLLGRFLFAALTGDPEMARIGAYVAGICVLIGHIYPIFFGFHGGKGVLTSAAIMLLVDPFTGLIAIGIFAVIVLCTKIVSLGSIIAAASMPVVSCILSLASGEPWVVRTIFSALLAAVIIFMHRANIKRLMNGTENKFGQGKKK